MSDQWKDLTTNLDFFKSAILQPVLEDLSDVQRNMSTVVSNFGGVEAAHWARLGVKIGYFDAKDAQVLISSSVGVLLAWYQLQRSGIISPQDDWAKVIRRGERGGPDLNTELFTVTANIAPRTQELVQNTFQTFLLLTAEDILDSHSRYFLDSIGWSDREEWNSRLEGTARRQTDSVQAIGFGFANVLSYWEEMDSASFSAEKRDAEYSAYPQWAHQVYRRGWSTDVGFPGGLTDVATVEKFTRDVRAILSRRFNLSSAEIVDRYFALAGEFANRSRDDSPEWLDARLRIFEELIVRMRYAGGGAIVSGDEIRLWNLFTKGVESSPAQNEERRVESPSERLRVEPPEEFER
jgi:hypothetical protein